MGIYERKRKHIAGNNKEDNSDITAVLFEYKWSYVNKKEKLNRDFLF